MKVVTHKPTLFYLQNMQTFQVFSSNSQQNFHDYPKSRARTNTQLLFRITMTREQHLFSRFFITFRLCFKFIVKLKFQYACIWDGNILKLCTEDNVKLLLAFKIEISSFLYNFTLHLWFFL